MDWQQVLFPVSYTFNGNSKSVGAAIVKNTGTDLELSNCNVALICIEKSGNKLSNTLRKHLYKYRNATNFKSFVDLGDYTLPNEITDSHIEELGFILSDLFEKGISIITFCNDEYFVPAAVEKAYSFLNQSYSAIECNITIAGNDDFGQLDADNWLSKSLHQKKPRLYHYGILGYQSNHIDNEQIEYLDKLGFEAKRLGELKGKISTAEPYVRTGNFLQFNYKSIKSSYTGFAHSYPNGLNGEEACAIFKYAGANNQMQIANLFCESEGQQKLLIEQYAQMVWYFMQGSQIGFEEDPLSNDDHYTQYLAHFEKPNESITFYKSQRSNKWWIYLPVDHKHYPRYKYLIPCDYADYKMAMKGEIPYRWITAIVRLDS